jgi:putative sterol carrier protein
VVRFLSDDWFDLVGPSLPQVADTPAELTIQQVVTSEGGAEVRYYIDVQGDRIAVHRGQAPSPDATITEDYGTAVAIARGELSAQEALLAGRIRIAGDVGALLRHRETLATLDPIPASVRKATTF